MSDLRDSGNIEEHADFVGLLYRPFYYTERSPAHGAATALKLSRRVWLNGFALELIIGKTPPWLYRDRGSLV